MQKQKLFFLIIIIIIVIVIIFTIQIILNEQIAKNKIRQLDMMFQENNFSNIENIFSEESYFIHKNTNITIKQAFNNYINNNIFINVYVGDMIKTSDKEIVLYIIGWLEMEGQTYEMPADVYLKREGLFQWKIKKIQSNSRYFYWAFFS